MGCATGEESVDHVRRALRNVMNDLGVCQAEVCEMLGVSAQTIERWQEHAETIPVEKRSEIIATEASVQRLQTLFRPGHLPVTIRRPADLFAGECALHWIIRGRIVEVVARYEAVLRYHVQ